MSYTGSLSRYGHGPRIDSLREMGSLPEGLPRCRRRMRPFAREVCAEAPALVLPGPSKRPGHDLSIVRGHQDGISSVTRLAPGSNARKRSRGSTCRQHRRAPRPRRRVCPRRPHSRRGACPARTGSPVCEARKRAYAAKHARLKRTRGKLCPSLNCRLIGDQTDPSKTGGALRHVLRAPFALGSRCASPVRAWVRVRRRRLEGDGAIRRTGVWQRAVCCSMGTVSAGALVARAMLILPCRTASVLVLLLRIVWGMTGDSRPLRCGRDRSCIRGPASVVHGLVRLAPLSPERAR